MVDVEELRAPSTRVLSMLPVMDAVKDGKGNDPSSIQRNLPYPPLPPFPLRQIQTVKRFQKRAVSRRLELWWNTCRHSHFTIYLLTRN
ncbi:hypothetical protein VTL71DRAFT_10801 [Oculimacula yallundae]|uniref:Uncharacterized protein n=1 Tax=Oculimacula yallundae TaxID=86028 RepID=A0ABR4CU54_9HELO